MAVNVCSQYPYMTSMSCMVAAGPTHIAYLKNVIAKCCLGPSPEKNLLCHVYIGKV